MVSTVRVYSQQTWLQRIFHGKCSHRFCKRNFFFSTGLIMVLILGFVVAGLSLGHRMFPFAMAMLATATVFLTVFIVVNVYVRRRSEEFTAPRLEEPWKYRIEHIEI